MNQCSSCGGFCKKSGCERVNATICKHFRLGLVTGFEPICPYCHIEELESQMQGLSNEINDFQNTIETLKGEQTVMVNLMMRALRVIETIESENSDEESEMTQLKGHMEKLINQSITNLMRVKNEKL